MPNVLSYIQSSDQSISNIRGVWLILLLPCFIEIPVSNANSIDPDQMPCSAASDLDLHCLLMSLLWDARHKWVKTFQNWRATLTRNKSTASIIPRHSNYKVIVAKMSRKKMTEGQITILNQILIISMHIASLVKRPLLFTQVIIQKRKYGRVSGR